MARAERRAQRSFGNVLVRRKGAIPAKVMEHLRTPPSPPKMPKGAGHGWKRRALFRAARARGSFSLSGGFRRSFREGWSRLCRVLQGVRALLAGDTSSLSIPHGRHFMGHLEALERLSLEPSTAKATREGSECQAPVPQQSHQGPGVPPEPPNPKTRQGEKFKKKNSKGKKKGKRLEGEKRNREAHDGEKNTRDAEKAGFEL